MAGSFAQQLWSVLLDLSPWLLFGAAVAGLLHVLLPRDFVRRHLGRRGGVLKAAVLGVPLPLCSCSVIPTGLSLRRDGASPGASVGFLISTPQTGVDSVLVSASFLGWPFAVFKLISAFVTGVVGGWLTNAVVTDATVEAEADQPTGDDDDSRPTPWSTAGLRTGLAHAIDMLRSIWGWLVIGVLASALISTLVSPGSFTPSSNTSTWLATLAVLAISVPLYVCATASVPIAAALVAAGLPPSAALVFLMAGPATNVATIGAIYRSLGARASAIYLGTIVIGSAGLGIAFDSVIAPQTIAAAAHEHEPGGWALASTLVMIGMLTWFAGDDVRRFWLARRPIPVSAVTLSVEGMTCNGCARKVENTLREVAGVTSVIVDLEDKRAVVTGTAQASPLIDAVQAAGFRAQAS